jgi:hypothetical protein
MAEPKPEQILDICLYVRISGSYRKRAEILLEMIDSIETTYPDVSIDWEALG